MTPEQRFWAKVNKTDECWLWTAATARGYGKFWSGERLVYAHRWAYENLVGEIPPTLTLDHLCRVRLCVRPAHLEVVTAVENFQRAVPYLVRPSRCPKGHPYSGENLQRWSAAQAARCRQCERDRYYRRAKAISEQRKLERRLGLRAKGT